MLWHKEFPIFFLQMRFKKILAVGTSWSLWHSLEISVVHPAAKQAAAPRQPPTPRPCVAGQHRSFSQTCTGDRGCSKETLYTHLGTHLLAFTVLLCAGERPRFVSGLSELLLCFVLPRLAVNRVTDTYGSDEKSLFTHCDCYFQHLDITSNGYLHHKAGSFQLKAAGERDPSQVTFIKSLHYWPLIGYRQNKDYFNASIRKACFVYKVCALFLSVFLLLFICHMGNVCISFLFFSNCCIWSVFGIFSWRHIVIICLTEQS